MIKSEPLYWLQLVDADGHPLTPPVRAVKMRHGSLDLPLIEACTAAILARAEAAIVAQGVGWFKSEAQVRAAIQAALPLAIHDGMAAAIQQLKDEYHPLVERPR